VRANQKTTHVFPADDEEAVALHLQDVVDRGGWVNFLPGREEILQEFSPREGPFSWLFGRPVQPYAMVSVVPGKVIAIGITHGAGRLTDGDLALRGLNVDADWRITQNHVRRGLIVEAKGASASLAHFIAHALRVLTAIPAQSEWTALRYGVGDSSRPTGAPSSRS
jgi:hypothetical protein